VAVVVVALLLMVVSPLVVALVQVVVHLGIRLVLLLAVAILPVHGMGKALLLMADMVVQTP
jgi:hypothetical protein